MYQQVNLSDLKPIGAPGALPALLAGLSDAQLSNLDTFSNPAPPGYAGRGFWPVVLKAPAAFDPATQVLVDPIVFVVDGQTHTVVGQQTARAMTADELAAANPVPASVTNYQARAALIGADLLDKVDAALRAADPTQPANKLALAAWDYANYFYRDQAFIVALGPTFGLTSVQIDDLFRAATKVP